MKEISFIKWSNWTNIKNSEEHWVFSFDAWRAWKNIQNSIKAGLRWNKVLTERAVRDPLGWSNVFWRNRKIYWLALSGRIVQKINNRKNETSLNFNV